MTKLALTATAAVFALAGAAHAQSMEARPYVNLGGTYLTEPEFAAGTLRGGVDFGDYLGVEAEGSMGLDGDDIGGVETQMDHMLAGFGRVRAPFGEQLEGFVRAGYYTMEASAEFGGVEVEADDDDFAAGAGLQWNFNEQHGVRADYTNYGIDDDGHSVSLAYVLGF